MTARRFCFTSYLADTPKMGCDCNYLIYQREVCPTTFREHWQGYAEFTCSKRYEGVRISLEAPGARIKQARGTWEDNKKYCSKEKSKLWGPFEYGTPNPGQGARMDVKAVINMVNDRLPNYDIYTTHPEIYMRMSRHIAAARAALNRPRWEKPYVAVWIGPTGRGKSKAVAELGGMEAYWKSSDKWWDDYCGQETVVLDEFRPSWWSLDYLLRLLDRYPFRVKTKGGSTNLCSKKILITTNVPIEEWYGEDEADKILRRIDTEVYV